MAFAGYGGFLLVAFGWRTLQMKRKSGDWSWRKPISRADAVGETLCTLGCSLTLAAPALALAGRVDPIGIDRLALRRVGSVACLVSGTAIALSAQRHLAEEWRVGVEASDSLVTTGPFSRVRNPFYVGCFLASAGVLIAVPSSVSLAGFLLHIAAAEVIVRAVEEPVLARAHGAEFVRYTQRTGRFLPTG
jgi:protein-S-isoprenylcysteine O-methyltransferase Ste14